MRHLAAIGLLLPALAGCQALPALVRADVHGSTLEFKKKAPPVPEAPATEPGNSADAPVP